MEEQLNQELLTLELQINKMIKDFHLKTGKEIIAINEDYNSFDDDLAHEGLRGEIVQLFFVPADEDSLAQLKESFA